MTALLLISNLRFASWEGFALRAQSTFSGIWHLASGSLGAMGIVLPAANWAAVTSQSGSVLRVTGDGSLIANLHELATMEEYILDLKLFVIYNGGYVSMCNAQRDFCNGHYVGADAASGVYIPPIDALARTFGLPYIRCDAQDDLQAIVREMRHLWVRICVR